MNPQRTTRFLATLSVALAFAPIARSAAADLGQPAPAFRLTDLDGQAHALADCAGKYVVLEWTNYECPFVQKHYRSGNLQAMQKDYAAKGVLWFSVNSSAPGKQGHYTVAEWQGRAAEMKNASTAILLDPEGSVGKAYGAKTTPHCFIIDPKGTLVYMGAVDDKPSTSTADVANALNYVREVLDAGLAGTPLAPKATVPYGCGVKY
jgi:peroxiredoxin